MADWQKDPYEIIPWEKDRLRRDREIRQLEGLRSLLLNQSLTQPRTIRPTYTSTVIQPPPAEYLVTYIGGPKNGFQEILERKEHPKLEDSKNYTLAIQQPAQAETFIKDALPPPVHISATYMMVFIPISQTPFTDIQCICAVFVQ